MSVARGGRQVVLHGLVMVLAGLVWGLFVSSVPYPRLALGAHIQMMLNGMLFLGMGTAILALRHGLGPKSMLVILLAAWTNWALVLSEAVNAWWGTTSVIPMVARNAGAPGGEAWQELLVGSAHIAGVAALIAAWGLLVLGFLRRPRGEEA